MSEEAVQRLMGLADEFARACFDTDGGAHDARSTLESALREVLMPAGESKQPEQPLGDALTGPGSTSLRSSDPYRDVPTSEASRDL